MNLVKSAVMVVVVIVVMTVVILIGLALLIYYESPPSFWSEDDTDCRKNVDCTAIVRWCGRWEPINKKHKEIAQENDRVGSEALQNDVSQKSKRFGTKENPFTGVAPICSPNLGTGPKPQALCEENTCVLLQIGPTWLEKLRGFGVFSRKDFIYCHSGEC